MCRSKAEGGARCKCQQGERRRAYQRALEAKRRAQGRLDEGKKGSASTGQRRKASSKKAATPSPTSPVEEQVTALREQRQSLAKTAAAAAKRRRENPEAFMAAVDSLGDNISQAARLRGDQELESKGLATDEQRVTAALQNPGFTGMLEGTYLDGNPELAAEFAKALRDQDIPRCRSALINWAAAGGLDRDAATELADITLVSGGNGSGPREIVNRYKDWEKRNPGYSATLHVRASSVWLVAAESVDEKVADTYRKKLIDEMLQGTSAGTADGFKLLSHGRQGGGSKADRDARQQWLESAAEVLPKETMESVADSFGELWLRGPRAGGRAAGYVGREKYKKKEPVDASVSFGRWDRQTGEFSSVEVNYAGSPYSSGEETYELEDADAVNRLVDCYNRGRTESGKPLIRNPKVKRVKSKRIKITDADGVGTREVLTIVPESKITVSRERSCTVLASDSDTTTRHELGHLVEMANPEIMDACNRFVDARTSGITRKTPRYGHTGTSFLNSYSTVRYPSGATEVMSTGIEQLLGTPDRSSEDLASMGATRTASGKVVDDPEHRNLILGLLSTSVERRRSMSAASKN